MTNIRGRVAQLERLRGAGVFVQVVDPEPARTFARRIAEAERRTAEHRRRNPGARTALVICDRTEEEPCAAS